MTGDSSTLKSTARPRVVLVEPEEDQREEIRSCLTEIGYEVDAPETADALRVVLAENGVGLLIIDSTVDATVLNVLRGRSEEDAGIPTICLAPTGVKEKRCRARVGKIDAVVRKPVNRKLLRREVERQLPPPSENELPVESPPATTDSATDSLFDRVDALRIGPFDDRPGPRGTVVPAIAESVLTDIQKQFREALRQTDAEPDAILRSLVDRLLAPAFGLELARRCLRTIDAHLQRDFAASAAIISLADLVQSLANKRLTGVLTVRSEHHEIELHIASGEVFFLNPRKFKIRYSLGHLYCNFRAFPVEYVDRLLEQSRRDRDSIFFTMLRDETIDADALSDTMVAFGLEVLRECMLEQDSCWYQFHSRESPDTRYMEHGVAMSAQSLMLKVTSDLDEWKAMQDDIAGSGVEYERTRELEKWELESLGTRQRAILEAMGESSSVLELAEACRLSPFEICKSLHRLTLIELVARVKVPELDLAGR